jgi:hypothetical protein
MGISQFTVRAVPKVGDSSRRLLITTNPGEVYRLSKCTIQSPPPTFVPPRCSSSPGATGLVDTCWRIWVAELRRIQHFLFFRGGAQASSESQRPGASVASPAGLCNPSVESKGCLSVSILPIDYNMFFLIVSLV